MWCALMVALAVVLWPVGGSRAAARLEHCRPPGRGAGASARRAVAGPLGGRNPGAYGTGRRGAAARVGIAQVIASAIARMKGGGTMLEAFEEQSGGRFAIRKLTTRQLEAVFADCRLSDESRAQSGHAAAGVAAAARLSDELGCRIVPCLEAVLDAYRQMRLMQQLTAQAFAVPKATVGLLSALPAATVLLGELMGSHPMGFLLTDGRGLICLMLGGCCYIAGLAWMRALMKGDSG